MRAAESAAAGELLPVEAIDPSGLIVRSDGALVHILAVSAPNPVVLSDADHARLSEGFQELVARLAAGQSLQFYVQSRPINVEDLLERARR